VWISTGPRLCIVVDIRELYLQATPLLLTLAVVELSDVAFAVSVSPTVVGDSRKVYF